VRAFTTTFDQGEASKRSAATFGAAKLRRVSPLLPRRCRRVAGPASADWPQRALGSPPSPDLSPSQLSPAHGSLARQRALRAAHLGRSSDELDRSHLSPQLNGATRLLSAAGSVPSWAVERQRDFTEALIARLRRHLHLATEAGIIVTAYADRAEGVMEVGRDGVGLLKSVTLRPP
jgi:hypothetical protein